MFGHHWDAIAGNFPMLARSETRWTVSGPLSSPCLFESFGRLKDKMYIVITELITFSTLGARGHFVRYTACFVRTLSLLWRRLYWYEENNL